jgi:8-oxo-dGTP pyrophosphatase MutT (NUDIX family)
MGCLQGARSRKALTRLGLVTWPFARRPYEFTSSIERMAVRKPEDKRISRGKNLSKVGRASRIQYGALPYRIAKTGSLELLLITTRQAKHWIIPKGWPVKGLKPAKSAAREAYEEAGIRGAISSKPIGTFSYEKRLEEKSVTVPCEVRVFALSVRRQLKRWPEAYERDSKWFEPINALSALKDDGLRELIASFVERTTGRPCK